MLSRIICRRRGRVNLCPSLRTGGGNGLRFLPGCGDNLFGLSLGLSQQGIGGITADLNGLGSRSRSLFDRRGHSILSKGRAWQQAGAFANLRHCLLPFDGHDMHTGHARNLFHLIDDVHADADAFLLLIFRALHPLDDLVGHIHARHELLHVVRHAQGLGRGHARKDVGLLGQAEVAGHLHELRKLGDVVDDLGLNEVCAVGDLLAHAHGPELERPGERVGCRAKEQLRCLALQLLAALELLRVAQVPHHAEELDRIHVEHALGAGMIAELLVIARQTEQILQA